MRRARREPGKFLNPGLLPMVDIGFLLLIAFLSSIRFVGLEEKVLALLPGDGHG